ncbi:PIN domain-containing protein [Microcystis aeruginosa CS-563/04]|jgi:predicted nucleic acid-binding protein|uniref:PIN domain-containing protein n=1 Tax=Microcystis aeruginosa TaxID=1126 RepID=UPI00232D478A|nr:PIN domain-containing protein [Microcystis aeruginosa]MDB9420659.1 PIN domain-containing protein [Microcystis aeruginosa CS-563/04]NCR09133.1 PIN domain-containing protein [Microcystis aeruginosa LG13-11]
MRRIFLDTNIYIIGQLKPLSPQERILTWLGYYTPNNQSSIKVIISQELINQILRVGKRLQGKDWAAKIVDQIWQNINCLFIPETIEMKAEASQIIAEKLLPSEDVFIYLTAKYGAAEIFLSENRELIKIIADFDYLTSEEFLDKYLRQMPP